MTVFVLLCVMLTINIILGVMTRNIHSVIGWSGTLMMYIAYKQAINPELFL